MISKNTRKINDWFSALVSECLEFTKNSRMNRCKIIGVDKDKKTKKIKLQVMISSIKSQICVTYFPEELITHDAMLREFSQEDVRAITFLALRDFPQDNDSVCYSIIGQEFLNEKTIFIIKELNVEGEKRQFADELYCNTDLLKKFKFSDLINIIHTAVQEQTVKDLG